MATHCHWDFHTHEDGSLEQTHYYHVMFELHIAFCVLILGHTVSLTNEQRRKELLATRDAALNNYPSSLCGSPRWPSEIREEDMPTLKQNKTSAPLIHSDPSKKKQWRATSILFYLWYLALPSGGPVPIQRPQVMRFLSSALIYDICYTQLGKGPFLEYCNFPNRPPLSLPEIISAPENPVEGEEFLCFIHDLNENPALTNIENESVLIEKSCNSINP